MQTKQHPFVSLLLLVSLLLECESNNTWTQIWFDDGTVSSLWEEYSSAYASTLQFNANLFFDVSTPGWIEMFSSTTRGIRSIYRTTNITGYSQLRLIFDLGIEMTDDSNTCSIHYSYNSLDEQVSMFTKHAANVDKVYREQEFSFPPIGQNSTLWLWLQAKVDSFYINCYWDNIYLDGILGTTSNDPTLNPTTITIAPSHTVTNMPSVVPSNAPTNIPYTSASILPSSDPSNNPTKAPTEQHSTDSPSYHPQFATSVTTADGIGSTAGIIHTSEELKSGQVYEETMRTENTVIVQTNRKKFMGENVEWMTIASVLLSCLFVCICLWMYRKKRIARLSKVKKDIDIIQMNKDKSENVIVENKKKGEDSVSEIQDDVNETKGNLNIADDEFVIQGDAEINDTLQ